MTESNVQLVGHIIPVEHPVSPRRMSYRHYVGKPGLYSIEFDQPFARKPGFAATAYPGPNSTSNYVVNVRELTVNKITIQVAALADFNINSLVHFMVIEIPEDA